MQHICGNPGCKIPFRHEPVAMERGNIVFCRLSCWEEWRRLHHQQPQLQLQEVHYAADYHRGTRIMRH